MSLIRVYVIAAVAFGLDRLSKLWIVHWLDLINIRVIEVYPPYLTFVMGWNTGVNFGLFKDGGETMRWVLIAITLIVCAGLTWWARGKSSLPLQLGIGMIIGGALGNGWDRLTYGAVADYLNMSCCGLRNPYTFNVADIFIFAGAALIIVVGDRTHTKTT